jgi:hypothetical protein
VRPRSRQSPKPKRARTDTPRSGRAKAPGSGARVVEPLAPTRNRWIRRVWPAAAALALLSVVAGLFYVLGSRRDSVTVGIALEKFGRAVELSPTAFIYSYHGRAWAYGMLGRYDESLEEERKLNEALTRQPRTDTFDRDFLEGRLLEAYLLSRTAVTARRRPGSLTACARQSESVMSSEGSASPCSPRSSARNAATAGLLWTNGRESGASGRSSRRPPASTCGPSRRCRRSKGWRAPARASWWRHVHF